MAVTKIWRVRGRAGSVIDYASNPEKTVKELSEEDLAEIADVLEYADDEVKTEKHHYTTGINCDKDSAKEEFELVKRQFEKRGGIVAIHGYQSFEEEDITPDEAHAIGVALAKELWGDRFQVIIATHLNTNHVHNHFVINSVSFKDGKRFHMCTARYLEMKDASDRLCREHRLSVIDHPQGTHRNYYFCKMEREGMPTRYTVARAALDDAISKSLNLEELKYELLTHEYKIQFSPNRKYWTITLPGWERPIRTYRLGDDYSKERILERVYENDESVRTRKYEARYNRFPNSYRLPRRINKINARTGLEKLYLRVCYEMGYLPKYRQDPLKVNALFRDELLRCDTYAKEARLLSENKINTAEDLEGFVRGREEHKDELMLERDEMRKFVKRKIPEAKKEKARSRITELTTEIKRIRSELKLCDDIKERSGIMAEKVKAIDMERSDREEVRS